MAVKRDRIVDVISIEAEYQKKRSAEIVGTLIEIVKETLGSGDDSLVSGFDKLSVKKKKVRKGRNPGTGEDMILASRRVVTFKCSGMLRDKIN
jgi:integration host factor subunit alpha